MVPIFKNKEQILIGKNNKYQKARRTATREYGQIKNLKKWLWERCQNLVDLKYFVWSRFFNWLFIPKDADAWPVRYFASQGLELLVSQSFGKNMSLYGERIGFLSGVVSDPKTVPAILSQLTLTIRPMVIQWDLNNKYSEDPNTRPPK